MFPFKKILVPLDGSEFAEAALEPALAIARALDAEVVLFRVAQPIPRTQALLDMPDVYEDVVSAAYREAEDYLEHAKARLSYDPILLEHRDAEGGVARQIVDYAGENDIDLVVMTSHGRTGVSRWVHGSVAEKVLTGCDCATLVLRCDEGGSDR